MLLKGKEDRHLSASSCRLHTAWLWLPSSSLYIWCEERAFFRAFFLLAVGDPCPEAEGDGEGIPEGCLWVSCIIREDEEDEEDKDDVDEEEEGSVERVEEELVFPKGDMKV